MKIIVINGTEVSVSAETLKRIERLAAEKKSSLGEAVVFCLEKVI